MTVAGTGVCETVTTYIAPTEHRSSEIKPFDWYLALIVAGAMEHRFPSTVIAAYRGTAAWVDEEKRRKLEADSLLQVSGFASVEQVLKPK